MIPLEPKISKVKPGLKLPYPSGRRWKELNYKASYAKLSDVEWYEDRLVDSFVNDAREIARAFSAITVHDDDMMNFYACSAESLTYKDLKGIMRARKRKESRLSKAVGSGEELPPKDFAEAFSHPTRGER